jgi:hypothetical protein
MIAAQMGDEGFFDAALEGADDRGGDGFGVDEEAVLGSRMESCRPARAQ